MRRESKLEVAPSEDLVRLYREAASDHRDAIDSGDPSAANTRMEWHDRG